MDITSLLIFLAIGALAGWLAGIIMKGGGFGLLGNIIVGIIGALVGGFLFGLLGRVHKIMLRVRDCWVSSTARGVEHGSFVLPYGRAI